MVRTRIEKAIDDALWQWVDWVRRHPWTSLLAVLLLSAAAVVYALNTLSINTDATEMIDEDKPFRVKDRLLRQAFPELSNQILVIVRGRTADEADYATERLAERLAEQSEFFQGVYAPSIEPYFQRQGLLFMELGELIDTTSRMASAAPLLQELVADPSLSRFFTQLSFAARAAEEGVDLAVIATAYDEVARVVEATMVERDLPLSWQALFGREAELHQRVLLVSPELQFDLLQPAKPAMDALKGAVAALPQALEDGVEIFITGEPVLRSQELQTVAEGMALSSVVSLIAVTLLLVVGLRAWQFIVAALLSLITSILITAGFAAVAIGELNLVSIAFLVLLIGLGIAFAIHLILQYREQRNAGADHVTALHRTMDEVGTALGLAAITTVIAFYAFVPTDFIGMAQLGIISGTGVLIAFVAALTVIPALLTLLPDVPVKPPRRRRWGRAAHAVEKAAVPVTVLAVLLGIAAAVYLPKVRFDADPMNLRNPASSGVQAFQLLFERPQDVPYRLNYLADDLQEAFAFERAVQQLPEVYTAITLEDFVPEDQEEKLAEIDFLAGDLYFVLTGEEMDKRIDPAVAQEEARRSLETLIEATANIASAEPDSQRGIAAENLHEALVDFRGRAADRPELYSVLEERLLRFFPMQIERLRLQLTARPVTLMDLPRDIVSRFVSETGLVRVEILPVEDVREPRERREFVDAVLQLDGQVAGSALSVLAAGDVVAAAMMQASGLALLLCAVVIFLIVRSFGFVVLVLVPLALAAIWTAATGVWVNLPFNFANVIVLPLLIGLGVDSSIHLVMRARHMAAGGAVFSTSTPRAVVLSTLATIASFGSLALSEHRGTASMGELLMIAIAYTLLATLVVLPGLLAIKRRLSRTEPEEAHLIAPDEEFEEAPGS